ncbi:hypothetical protein HND92_03225 [Diaphorobacter sp. JS3050]|uniref:beta strand repeat-containing protein n=1 Tax=Diaphorobacter sp. JS3050 TaxID=2735554 RepID=UPI00155579D7|nr:hypothetical protein [Diaphorobacter sp. JS3050]QJY31500.1 hypothetical protein HND92_03225 [Diaphorobacter sp. JS3050]
MTYFTTGAQLQAALNALPNTKTGNFVAFDSFFYGQQYMADYQGTLSPIEHFVQIGAARGYKPNATFDPTYYKNAFADLKNTNLNAADLLYHFLKYGLDEGRTPNAELATFNGTAYLAANPDVAAYVNANLAQFGGSVTNGALAHYVKFGAAEGRTAPGTSVSNGQTFTLTTGTDAIVGTSGNDTINGMGDSEIVGGTLVAAKTLGAADTIDGGAGVDTLNLTFTATAADVTNGAIIKNVEVLNVRQVAGTATLNADNVAGLTNVNLSTSVGNLTVTNLAAGAAAGIIGNGTTTEGVLTYDYKLPTSAVTLNLAGGVKQAAAVNQITTTAGTATTATINSTGAKNTTGGINLSSGTTVTALTINADADLTVTDGAAATAEITGFKNGVTNNSITVKGAATAVNIGLVDATVGTLDASGLTAGGLTATSANADLVVKGGAGKDTITLTAGAALSTKASITLGAGDDKLLASAGTTLGNQVADGGDGIDTIAATLINVASATNVKNFEVLDLAGYNSSLDAALLTASTITKAALTGATGVTGATLINLPSTTALDVTGFADQAAYNTATLGIVNLKQKDAATGTADALTVTFNANATADQANGGNFSTVNQLNVSGTETVNIASTGSAKVDGNAIIALSDTLNQLKTVVITGDKAFRVDDVSTNTAATAATADVASSLTLIDGSAATGKLTITAGAPDAIGVTGFNTTYTGLTIKGGSAADTITIGAKNGVVDAGAGNDKITVNDLAATKGNVTSVTGGAGVDTLESNLTYQAVATATSSATDGNYVLFADAASKDVISFATLTFANASGAFGAKANIGAAATFDQAVLAAEGTFAANTVSWFQYGGDTYVANSGAAAGTADNVVIKLTGLVDLSAAVLDTAADTITLA